MICGKKESEALVTIIKALGVKEVHLSSTSIVDETPEKKEGIVSKLMDLVSKVVELISKFLSFLGIISK